VDHDDVCFHIAVNPDNGTVDNEIYIHGVYEPYYLSRIKSELRVGDNFVDVGSNIGQHSLFASGAVGARGHVYAFEPIQKLHNQIKRSIDKNIIHNKAKNITLYNIGLGDTDMDTAIYATEKNMGGSSMVIDDANRKAQTVHIKRGDDVLMPLNKKIDFIKIDVEGYEYKVLVGLQDILEKYTPKIFLEYSLSCYDQYSPGDAERILQILHYFGYMTYDLDNNDAKVNLKYLKKMREEGRGQANFLALRIPMNNIH
jgi:FkbM family methyltransferase